MAELSRRDRGITAVILGFFAAAWFGWAHADASTSLSSWLNVAGFAALAVAVIGLVVAIRSPRAGAIFDNPKSGRRYGIIVGIEFALCFVGAAVLGGFGNADYIPAWICLVVGVHFWPLAPVLRNPRLKGLAVLTTLVAIAAFAQQATGKAQASTVAGIGAGLLLLGFAVLGLISLGRRQSPA